MVVKNKKKVREGIELSVLVFFMFCAAVGGYFMNNQTRKLFTFISLKNTGNESRIINEHRQYESPTTKTDCYLCNENADSLLSFYWGQNNIAVVDLNTFDFYVPEINQYNDDMTLIDERAGNISIISRTLRNGEKIVCCVNSDRGFADCTIGLGKNSIVSVDNAAEFLCSECLTDIMNQYIYSDNRWNIALLNLSDKSIKPLDETVGGFASGDFNVKCRYDKDKNEIDLHICYSHIRY